MIKGKSEGQGKDKEIYEMIQYVEKLMEEAGENLRKEASKPMDFQRKDQNIMDIVTEHDKNTERYLIEGIRRKYAEHGFIAEEGEVEDQGFKFFTWVIDPIDGTTNFVNLGKDFAISVALYIDQKPFAGLVYDVMQREMVVGIKGKGVWVNEKPYQRNKRNLRLENAVMEISFTAELGFKKNFNVDVKPLVFSLRGHRNYGVAALTIVKMAKGELEGYLASRLYLWDYAAAGVILREMGGEFFPYPKEEYSEGYETKRPHESIAFLGASSKDMLEKITEKLHNNE